MKVQKSLYGVLPPYEREHNKKHESERLPRKHRVYLIIGGWWEKRGKKGGTNVVVECEEGQTLLKIYIWL